MRKIKYINILLSCPGDVEEAFLTSITDTIIKCNIFLNDLGYHLDLSHWRNALSPGRGSPRAQDKINNELLEYCDIYIGILWTRFGSPPGVSSQGKAYSSGTEEEFYRAKESLKKIVIFFCDCDIKPSMIDTTQLQKIKDFKKKLESQKILHGSFNSKDDLEVKLMKSLRDNTIGRSAVAEILPTRHRGKPKRVNVARSEFKKFNRGF